MPVRGLQPPFLAQRRAVAAQAHAHRRKEVRLRRLPEAIHEERSLGEARETPRQRQVLHVNFLEWPNRRLPDGPAALEAESAAGADAATNAIRSPVGTASAGGLKDAPAIIKVTQESDSALPACVS